MPAYFRADDVKAVNSFLSSFVAFVVQCCFGRGIVACPDLSSRFPRQPLTPQGRLNPSIMLPAHPLVKKKRDIFLSHAFSADGLCSAPAESKSFFAMRIAHVQYSWEELIEWIISFRRHFLFARLLGSRTAHGMLYTCIQGITVLKKRYRSFIWMRQISWKAAY